MNVPTADDLNRMGTDCTPGHRGIAVLQVGATRLRAGLPDAGTGRRGHAWRDTRVGRRVVLVPGGLPVANRARGTR